MKVAQKCDHIKSKGTLLDETKYLKVLMIVKVDTYLNMLDGNDTWMGLE